LPESNREGVRAFLRRFKSIAAPRGIYFVDREETDQTLVQLGLTRGNCKEEILALSVLDYVDGPLPDINRTGHVWIFGKTIHGVEVYIKLKLVDTEEGDGLKPAASPLALAGGDKAGILGRL